MEMRFIFILETQRTLGKIKGVCEGVERVVEPMWEMERPVSLPITIPLEPSYGL